MYFPNFLEKQSPATKALPAVYSIDKAYNFSRGWKNDVFIFGEQKSKGGYKLSFMSNNMKQTIDFHIFQTKTWNFFQLWHVAFVNYCDSLNPGF